MSSANSTSSSSATFFEGILLSSITLLLWNYHRVQTSKNKFEDGYWAERRGRTRVEKEMKKLSNIRLNTEEGFFVQPIGSIHSCYRQCVGTPRQGLLVPHSRSSIVLKKNISPESLAGLQDFSHVWLTFQFHMNTNVLKESKAFDNGQTFNAKICAPMLKGKRMGVLATRSPHRPNPVGVTLAQIRYIDKAARTIYLCACDLVEGTPILDVKVIATFYSLLSYGCIKFHYFLYYSHMFQLMTLFLSSKSLIGLLKQLPPEMKSPSTLTALSSLKLTSID